MSTVTKSFRLEKDSLNELKGIKRVLEKRSPVKLTDTDVVRIMLKEVYQMYSKGF